MGELAAYAKRNSAFLQLNDGESQEVEFVGYKIGANPFDPDKEMVMYQVRALENGELGAIKSFKSQSAKVALFFDGVTKGTRVKITRHGKEKNTKYDLAVV